MTQVHFPMRVAFRHEGEFWNAYIAKAETMADAILIGSIAMRSAKRNPVVKDTFIDLMTQIFRDAAAELGLPVSEMEIRPGPEHERGGRA